MRTFICTLGTSIANRLGNEKDESGKETSRLVIAQRRNAPWGATDPDSGKFGRVLSDWIDAATRKGSQIDLAVASAELTILAKEHVSRGDKVVLVATDTFLGECCGRAVKRCIVNKFSLDDDDIAIDRVSGLQVNDRDTLLQDGFGNFLDIVRKRIEEASSLGREVALCPNGGFKGVVPFLTILGMLNGCKVVYTFEHAGCVIEIPALPFSLSGEYFRRASAALKTLTEKIEMPEADFLELIDDYVPEERALFLGFVQRLPNGMVTPLSLLEHLIDAAETPYAMLSNKAIEKMKSLEGTNEYTAFADLIMRVQNPVFLNKSRHSLQATDMLGIKTGSTPERLIGYEVGDLFYVALAMNHKEYDMKINGDDAPRKADFPPSAFHRWEPAGVRGKRGWSTFECLQRENEKANLKIEELEKKVSEDSACIDQALADINAKENAIAKAQSDIAERDGIIMRLQGQLDAAEAEFERYKNERLTLTQALKMWWRRRQ